MAKTIVPSSSAIGTRSRAVRCGAVEVSGRIGLDPGTMQLVDGIDARIHRVFQNLRAIAEASGTALANAVKLTICLVDLARFAKGNEIMAQRFPQPYPSRATLEVAALPRGAPAEADAVLERG